MNATLIEQTADDIVHVGPETPVEDMLAIYRRDGVLIDDGRADQPTLAALPQEPRSTLGECVVNTPGPSMTLGPLQNPRHHAAKREPSPPSIASELRRRRRTASSEAVRIQIAMPLGRGIPAYHRRPTPYVH